MNNGHVYRIKTAGISALLLALFLFPAPGGALDYDRGFSTEDLGGPFNTRQPAIKSSQLWPCSKCHATMKTNPDKRRLEHFHQEKVIENHGEPTRWCLDCHNANDRDTLRLIGGESVPFDRLYRLCAQCHATVFQDWEVGIHGRRRGYWNAEKRFFLCTECHNPHNPPFKPLAPEPVPDKPAETLYW